MPFMIKVLPRAPLISNFMYNCASRQPSRCSADIEKLRLMARVDWHDLHTKTETANIMPYISGQKLPTFTILKLPNCTVADNEQRTTSPRLAHWPRREMFAYSMVTSSSYYVHFTSLCRVVEEMRYSQVLMNLT